VRGLAGTDERAPIRRKAWEALSKWISSRVSRQRGVHVPNLFQVAWVLVATDETGTRLRRPIFVLSERFADNFGVKQAGYVERNVPPPANGDDVNFYQLAIQHSDGLSKDQAFSSIREMVMRLGEAAREGREVRVDMGAGTLVIEGREIGFEFQGGLGGGAGAEGGTEKVSHLDPMLNGRLAGGGSGSGLEMQGAAVAAPSSPTRSMLSNLQQQRRGGSGSELSGRLSAEEEAALFADVDLLDPESRIEVSQMRAAELEGQTRIKVSEALDLKELGDRSVEELNEALGARAAALESQLRAQRAETERLEAQLKAKAPNANAPSGSRLSRGKLSRVPAMPHVAGQPERLSGGPSGTLTVSGAAPSSHLGGGSSNSGRLPAAPRRAGAPKPSASSISEAGPPMLSVGFSKDGPGQLGTLPPPPRGAVAAGHVGYVSKPPIVSAILSDINSNGHSGGGKRSDKVPTAPPLPPFRFSAPQPNDAANQAWKRHAAPQVTNARLKAGAGGGGGSYGRPVGGPAPPFLAAPPSLAAAMLAKSGK